MTNIEHQSFLNIRVGCRNWTVGISHRQGERKRNQMFTLVMNEMEADRKKSFKLQTIDGAFVSKFCHLLDRICTCKMECPMELSTWKGTDENEWCGFNDIHQSNGEVTRTPPQFLSSLRVKPEPNQTKQNKDKNWIVGALSNASMLRMAFSFCRCLQQTLLYTSRLNQTQTIQLPIFIGNHSNAQ